MLPIGVIIPTRNSARLLPHHLRELAEWLPEVAQVVAVDSFSQDGTLELLKSGLRHPDFRILQQPPGLYESWNYGIRQLEPQYTYISTVGDMITLDGLLHLLEVAQQFQADLVLSPPSFITSGQVPIARKLWTIHRYLEARSLTQPLALPSSHLFLTSVFAGMSGMMGSSASNLYRTTVLQHRPFPTDFGHVGDSAWGLANAFDIKAAITPRECASFLIHPNEGEVSEAEEVEMEAKLLDLAHTSLAQARGRRVTPPFAKAFEQVMEQYKQTHERERNADSLYQAYRKELLFWFLRPGAWRARRERNQHRAAVRQLWQRTLAEFSF